MRHTDQWLAVLRIATGAWFIKAIWFKWVLLGGILPVPMASQRWIETLPRIVQGYVEVNPLGDGVGLEGIFDVAPFVKLFDVT